MGHQTDRRNGVSESGQSDYWADRGRGCWIWTGEHGCRDEGNMGESE